MKILFLELDNNKIHIIMSKSNVRLMLYCVLTLKYIKKKKTGKYLHIYIYNDDSQNYPFSGLQLVLEMFGHKKNQIKIK